MEGPTEGSSNNTHKVLIVKAILGPKILQVATTCNSSKDPKLIYLDITFSKRKAYRLIHPHIYAIVVTLLMANITLH